jgi:hypothetical protein
MLNKILSKWINYKLVVKKHIKSEKRSSWIEQFNGNDLLAWKIICSLFSIGVNKVC